MLDDFNFHYGSLIYPHLKYKLLNNHFTITFLLKVSNKKRKRTLINYRFVKILNINALSNENINSLTKKI